jgi:recombinational DNA repair protein (RecF pathway)
MAKVVCNTCGEKKDKDNGYYKSNPSTCKECWKKACSAIHTQVKNKTIILLAQILEEQREIRSEITSSLEDFGARIKKLEKAMKKISTKDD